MYGFSNSVHIIISSFKFGSCHPLFCRLALVLKPIQQKNFASLVGQGS